MSVGEAARRTGMSENDLRNVNNIPPRMLIKAGSQRFQGGPPGGGIPAGQKPCRFGRPRQRQKQREGRQAQHGQARREVEKTLKLSAFSTPSQH
jgi:hypothetical protein